MKSPNPLFALTAAVVLYAVPLVQAQPINVEVAAVLGTAMMEEPGGTPTPAAPGVTLKPGTTLRTNPRSAVDLFLGNTAGTLRLTQNSTLKIVKFSVTADKVTEIELLLTTGSVLGLGNRVEKDIPYLIKVSNGILDTHAKQFRINAKGLVVCLDGALAFAHIPEDGPPQLHPIDAPPAFYFWPNDGVKLAPPALIREVQSQLNARLPSR